MVKYEALRGERRQEHSNSLKSKLRSVICGKQIQLLMRARHRHFPVVRTLSPAPHSSLENGVGRWPGQILCSPERWSTAAAPIGNARCPRNPKRFTPIFTCRKHDGLSKDNMGAEIQSSTLASRSSQMRSAACLPSLLVRLRASSLCWSSRPRGR